MNPFLFKSFCWKEPTCLLNLSTNMQSSLNHAVIKGSKIPVCISLRTPEQIVHYKLFGHTIKIVTYHSEQLFLWWWYYAAAFIQHTLSLPFQWSAISTLSSHLLVLCLLYNLYVKSLSYTFIRLLSIYAGYSNNNLLLFNI